MRGHCRSALGSALVILAIGLAAPVQAADLDPELGGVETMAMPGDHWFMFLNSLDGGSPYSASSGIFDADTGQMQGRLNLSDYTSAVYLDRGRGKIYLPASFYSRGTYGDRTDLLIINDVENLAPVAEIEVPTKLAVVFHRAVINPIGGNFVGLYNMTPAMSVSVVDVENQKFVGEISTAGCGFVYPLNGRRFLQLCGDGTVQMIDLDADGQESARQRSRVFFDVDEDPVFDLALEKPDGLVLVTFAGRVFEVTVDGDDIDISSPWSLLSDQDRAESWWVGGSQPIAYNAETGTLLALMHQGEKDTHEDSGTEVWAFDTRTQQRLYRLQLEMPSHAVAVSNDGNPLMYLGFGPPGYVEVRDAADGDLLRVIPETGLVVTTIQAF